MNGGFDIEPKPLETIPYKSAKEQVEEAIKNLHGVGFEVPTHVMKLKVDDYYNVIKSYLANKALQTMGFEPKTNWMVLGIIGLLIAIIVGAVVFFGK